MDSFALKLEERLRPWHKAGLLYVFGKPGHDRFAQDPKGPDESGTGPRRPDIPGRNARFGDRSPAASANKPSAPREPTPAEDGKPESSSPEWPNPWDVYLTFLKIPCRTVWTYWDLGWDLGPRPSDARRQLLRTIIEKLHELAGWKKGSVTFWPVAGVTAKGLVADPERFWKGVRKTGASHVVVFGRRAFEVLFPDRAFKFGVFEHEGLAIVVLPGPGNVLADRDGAKHTVWKLLRSLDIR